MKLMVICVWCRQFICFKDLPGDHPPKKPITHGICAGYKRELEKEIQPAAQIVQIGRSGQVK
jgi:hypothetical protein